MQETRLESIAQDLRKSVTEAFREWEQTEDVADDIASTHEDEKEDLYCLLRGTEWRNVPRKVITKPGAAIWLSDCTFTYYLPAFLLAALDEDCDWEFYLLLVNRIAPPWKRDSRPKFGLEVQRLSVKQLQVVEGVLTFLSQWAFEDSSGVQRRIREMCQVLLEMQ